jgi:hypothetical protein
LPAGGDEFDFVGMDKGQQPFPHPVRGRTPRLEAVDGQHEPAGTVRALMERIGDPVQPRFIPAGIRPVGHGRIQGARQLRMIVHVQTVSVGQARGEPPEQRRLADPPGPVEMKDGVYMVIRVLLHLAQPCRKWSSCHDEAHGEGMQSHRSRR